MNSAVRSVSETLIDLRLANEYRALMRPRLLKSPELVHELCGDGLLLNEYKREAVKELPEFLSFESMTGYVYKTELEDDFERYEELCGGQAEMV